MTEAITVAEGAITSWPTIAVAGIASVRVGVVGSRFTHRDAQHPRLTDRYVGLDESAAVAARSHRHTDLAVDLPFQLEVLAGKRGVVAPWRGGCAANERLDLGVCVERRL